MNLADANRTHEIFEDELVGRFMIQFAPGTGMLLVTSHGRCGVVQDDKHVPVRRRVIDHLDQAADSTMNERAIANHADDSPGLTVRQDMAKPQTDAKAGTHTDAGVDGLERLKHTERIAANVPRDDAIPLAQGIENDAILAAVTKLR